MTTLRRLIDTPSSTMRRTVADDLLVYRGFRDARSCVDLGLARAVISDERGTSRAMTIRYSILAFSALLAALPAAPLQRGAQNDRLDFVDAKGNIRKPADYRDRYQALGVYTVLDPAGDEMHYAYATPGT